MENISVDVRKIQQALDQSASNLSPAIIIRIVGIRDNALRHQRVSFANYRFSGFGSVVASAFMCRARMSMAIVGLTLSIVGAYYWNAFQQADENAEIDSALLADDLPLAAYTDQGFQAWLEGQSPPSTVQ